MEKTWLSMPIVDKREYQGILSKEKPFEFSHEKIKINDKLVIDIHVNKPVTKEIFIFIFENGISQTGNSYIVNPKTLLSRVFTYITDNSDKDKFLGFMLSVPHGVKIGKERINSSLSTHLTVSLKHRKEGIAAYLIKSIIYYGWENSIYTGYHYINEPRTHSNVLVYSFFRPLNIENAKSSGYQFNEESLTTRDNQDYMIRDSVYEDLDLINKVKRNVNINLDEVEYNNLKQDCIFYSITHKSKVVGIMCVKPIALHIAKTSKICNVARMVYFESLDKHAYHVMEKCINHLSNKEYVVLSGVTFGSLNNGHLRKNLGLIISGKLFLDFYNINLMEENKNSSEINLIYI